MLELTPELHEGARIIAFWMHDACKLLSPARRARDHDRLFLDVRERIRVLLQRLSVAEQLPMDFLQRAKGLMLCRR